MSKRLLNQTELIIQLMHGSSCQHLHVYPEHGVSRGTMPRMELPLQWLGREGKPAALPVHCHGALRLSALMAQGFAGQI